MVVRVAEGRGLDGGVVLVARGVGVPVLVTTGFFTITLPLELTPIPVALAV